MDKKYVIFDLDGTLTDSEVYWDRTAVELLCSKGVTEVSDEVMSTFRILSVEDAAEFFVQHFKLDVTTNTFLRDMNVMMKNHYMNNVKLKKGAMSCLKSLQERGVRMCVASASNRKLVELCLSVQGIEYFFDFIITCAEVGSGKDRPDIYEIAAEKLGGKPYEIAVFEDSLIAARTAKLAGFYVCAVYDESSEMQWEELCAISDEAYINFEPQ